MGRAPEQPFSYIKTLSIIAMPSSRGSSRPRDRTWTSNVSCIDKRFFTISLSPGKPSHHQINANQNDNEIITSHLLGWLLSRRREKTIVGKDREKATLMHCWWECKLVQPLLKGRWRFLNNLKIGLQKKKKTPHDPAMPLLLKNSK